MHLTAPVAVESCPAAGGSAPRLPSQTPGPLRLPPGKWDTSCLPDKRCFDCFPVRLPFAGAGERNRRWGVVSISCSCLGSASRRLLSGRFAAVASALASRDG